MRVQVTLLAAARMALREMENAVAPSDSFVKASDMLEAAIYVEMDRTSGGQMAKSETTVVASALAAIDMHIADLQRARMILVSAVEDAGLLEGPTAPRQKRGRGKNKPKPGLSTGGDVADESTRMHV